jgi:hypothetical protein
MEIASREIYPENATAILARLLGKNGNGHIGAANAADPGVRPVKKLFRNNSALKALRGAFNGLFAAVPIGDELLAFAIKK